MSGRRCSSSTASQRCGSQGATIRTPSRPAAFPPSPPTSTAVALLGHLSLPKNAELFTLTYGAIVRQLLTDLEEVNKQLDQMGYNLGTRLVDEFLAKSNVSNCVDFKETADTIAKVHGRR